MFQKALQIAQGFTLPVIISHRRESGVLGSNMATHMVINDEGLRWSHFIGQVGGQVKVYSGVLDHAARVLFNTSCCSGRAGRVAGELRR